LKQNSFYAEITTNTANAINPLKKVLISAPALGIMGVNEGFPLALVGFPLGVVGFPLALVGFPLGVDGLNTAVAGGVQVLVLF